MGLFMPITQMSTRIKRVRGTKQMKIKCGTKTEIRKKGRKGKGRTRTDVVTLWLWSSADEAKSVKSSGRSAGWSYVLGYSISARMKMFVVLSLLVYYPNEIE